MSRDLRHEDRSLVMDRFDDRDRSLTGKVGNGNGNPIRWNSAIRCNHPHYPDRRQGLSSDRPNHG